MSLSHVAIATQRIVSQFGHFNEGSRVNLQRLPRETVKAWADAGLIREPNKAEQAAHRKAVEVVDETDDDDDEDTDDEETESGDDEDPLVSEGGKPINIRKTGEKIEVKDEDLEEIPPAPELPPYVNEDEAGNDLNLPSEVDTEIDQAAASDAPPAVETKQPPPPPPRKKK